MINNIIFSAKIVDIGSGANDFLNENMAIFFNEKAPEELYKHCFIIKTDRFNDDIKVGDAMKIGNSTFEIVFVGGEANKNFVDLGHITLFFNRDFSEALPGSIFVTGEALPNFKIGEILSIEREDD